MHPLKTAVIGLGVGESHLEAMRQHPGCKVVAVCDLDPEKLRGIARRYPRLETTVDAEEVLDDPQAASHWPISSTANFMSAWAGTPSGDIGRRSASGPH